MQLDALEAVGLSKGEITVYTALLHAGQASLEELHRASGLERRAIYDILAKLRAKGLATSTKVNRRQEYCVGPPAHMTALLEAKAAAIANATTLLPSILQLHAETKPSVSIEVLHGKEGMKALFDDMLDAGTCYFIGGGFYVMDLMPEYWQQYDRKRFKKKTWWHNLARHETRGRPAPSDHYFKLRYLPEPLSKNPSVVFIYNDKTVNVLWSNDWHAFVITSKEIADNHRAYHAHLWKQCKA
ncbi:hypothetical protein AUJ68_05610 [Candidatus Woesearchaeota archaeon CG1_02_57_44]|nr:MAG: hypothetical protein AUJ68_05610 [Candidatus Woesearchaeota archaeon CG1_02_57_44]